MSNQRIVQDLYEAFACKDEARLRELLAPDVEWIQCAGFPGGGRRRGADEVLSKVFTGLRAEWPDWRVVIDEHLDAGLIRRFRQFTDTVPLVKAARPVGSEPGRHPET